MTYNAMYKPILTLSPLPKMISAALTDYGTLELAGSGNNPAILRWRDQCRKAGLDVAGYSADSVPWCGLGMAHWALNAGKQGIPKHPLWALNWAQFGTEGHQPCLGDVLVFQRPSGGHVTLYVAEDKTHYHCLGGNQSDQVNITRVEKRRLYAVRRPPVTTAASPIAKPYIVDAKGLVTTNEH